MKIGINLDGVITDYYDHMITYGKFFAQENKLNCNQIKLDYDNVEKIFGWDLTITKKFKLNFNKNIISNIPPRPLMKEIINKLIYIGAEVYIFAERETNYFDNVNEDVKEWLEKFQISYTKLYVGTIDKIKICEKEKIKILIDDNKDICALAKSKNIKTLLFDNYYNENLHGIIRVCDSYEIYNYILNEFKLEDDYSFIPEIKKKKYIDSLIKQFEIATDRLYIRKFKLEDTYDFYEMMSSKKVTKYLSGGINSLDKARKFLKKQISRYEIGKKLSFAIILKESNNLIGNIVLELDDENSSIEISYVLNDSYWNKGYTTEIVQNIINIIFTKLDFNRIYAGIISDNVASIRVLEKCKMKYEGKLKQAKYDKKTNKYNDYIYYAILKDEYMRKE